MAKPGAFVKGDPRINRHGRPKSFDALRELALQIAHEVAQHNGEDVVINGHKVTVAEMILRRWSTSPSAQLQRGFLEVAFGKVPDETILRGNSGVKFEIEYVNKPYPDTELSSETNDDTPEPGTV